MHWVRVKPKVIVMHWGIEIQTRMRSVTKMPRGITKHLHLQKDLNSLMVKEKTRARKEMLMQKGRGW